MAVSLRAQSYSARGAHRDLHENVSLIVMARLVPAIHALRRTESNPWMRGTRPGMTRRVGSSYFRGSEAITRDCLAASLLAMTGLN